MQINPLKEGEEIAKKGIFNLLVLGILKIIAGLVTGMTVLLADALSSFADILGVFASYLGLKLSRKNADQNFSYGYYKIETFAALLISLGIIYLGYFIIKESLSTFKTPAEAKYRLLGVISTIIAIISSHRLSKVLNSAGEKANSLALITAAKDKKMDVIAGVVILISIFANYQHIPYVEGIVTLTIAIIILKVGFSSAKESLFFLLDYWNDHGLLTKIKNIFKSEKDLVLRLRKLRLRRAGTFIFGEAFIDINPFAGINDLREELDILQKKITDLNPYIKDFAIYSHIPQAEKVKIAIPIKSGKDLNAKVASTLNSTNAYLFIDVVKNKIKNLSVKKLAASQKKTIQLSNFIQKEKVNILMNNNLNSLVYYNLRRTHHVLIYPNFSKKTAKEALNLILIDA